MVEISTSILSVEKEAIIKTIYNLEVAKTDFFHIDVMDGIFVENNTAEKMVEYCDYLINITNIPLDIHLMVSDVRKYVDLFLPYNPNIITIHYEAFENKEDLIEMINYIKSNNIKVGLSIKPQTSVEEIYEFINKINLVLIMTVEPGQGGQKIIASTINKIKEISDYIKENELDVLVEADGGINTSNSELIKTAGADIIVAGTSIISSENYSETIKQLK